MLLEMTDRRDCRANAVELTRVQGTPEGLWGTSGGTPVMWQIVSSDNDWHELGPIRKKALEN